MDGSKRSKHSNAFICSSFGKKEIGFVWYTVKRFITWWNCCCSLHMIGHSKLHHLSYGLISGIISFAFVMIISITIDENPRVLHGFWIFVGKFNKYNRQLSYWVHIGFHVYRCILMDFQTQFQVGYQERTNMRPISMLLLLLDLST